MGKTKFHKFDLDVAFIDGLHTYKQSLNDCINSIYYLSNQGIILLHDCNPPSKKAAHPEIPTENINWNGDVWKTIYHLRQFPDYFDCFTINSDQGIGIVRLNRKPTKDQLLKMKFESRINDLPYEFFASDREKVIGLKTFQ